MWDSITLECEGQKTGITASDQFQIQLKVTGVVSSFKLIWVARLMHGEITFHQFC